MVAVRFEMEEMKVKMEAMRKENVSLKKVQSMQGNELQKHNAGTHHVKISQLMNELRHFKEKNNNLTNELAKRGQAN